MIDVKHHNNASGTAFIDFTEEKHQTNLPGTFFSYVIKFPLYLSCSFSERCFSGFLICSPTLHSMDCGEGPGRIILEHCRNASRLRVGGLFWLHFRFSFLIFNVVNGKG
jgi:hypothetical protein